MIAREVGRTRHTLSVLATSSMMVGGLVVATPAAAAQTVTLTVNCDAPVVLDAEPGDTVVVQMGSGCSTDWSVWNINGVNGNQTASGFLAYAGSLDDVSCNFDCSQGPTTDWYDFQTDERDLSLTTVLTSVDGAGNPLTVGAIVAEFDNQDDAGFAITYRGTASTSLTVNCDAPVTLSGSPGAVVLITLGPGCSTDWRLWNINGLSSRQTAAGFLRYAPVSTTQPGDSCNATCVTGPPDWSVSQSGGLNLAITAVLQPTDGAGSAITPGAVVAELDNQSGTAYPITYLSPGLAFGTCKDLLATYPRGISKSAAAATRAYRSGRKRPAVRRDVYNASQLRLDGDKDGVMCEQRRTKSRAL